MVTMFFHFGKVQPLSHSSVLGAILPPRNSSTHFYVCNQVRATTNNYTGSPYKWHETLGIIHIMFSIESHNIRSKEN